MNYLREKNDVISPFLKWTGGKSDCINYLRKFPEVYFPNDFERYFEPFLGGGAMWLNICNKDMFVNDTCKELILFYELLRDENKDLCIYLNKITDTWNVLKKISDDPCIPELFQKKESQLVVDFLESKKEQICSNLFSDVLKEKYFSIIKKCATAKVLAKFKRTEQELRYEDLSSNFESALKSGLYTYIRNVFNHFKKDNNVIKVCCFYFLRHYAFSSMFRYNLKGDFNIPYGGISYNKKRPNKKIKNWKNQDILQHLKKTTFSNLDFYDFLTQSKPTKDDFIFLDPPYDSEFNTYAENIFGDEEQKKLANYLLNECEAKFMAVMKSSPLIEELYKNSKICDIDYAKEFPVQHKFNKNCSVKKRKRQHILIKNY